MSDEYLVLSALRHIRFEVSSVIGYLAEHDYRSATDMSYEISIDLDKVISKLSIDDMESDEE